jgi:CO dehydrogenase maturation factor
MTTRTIALAGKGGTGKTTIAGLLIRTLVERREGPVLAIDADPASNLNVVLGLPLDRTVGDIREETTEKARNNLLDASVPKRELLDYEVNANVVEGVGVDLLAMGRPEGPGCYCAANNMLRGILDRIADGYRWVVIDNEAGLEHLSRRTTRDVDELIVVSDPSVRGITTAGRVVSVLDELQTRVGRSRLVVNRVAPGGLPPELREAIAASGLVLSAELPADAELAHLDAVGRSLVELPADDPVATGVRAIVEEILSVPKEAVGADHR